MTVVGLMIATVEASSGVAEAATDGATSGVAEAASDGRKDTTINRRMMDMQCATEEAAEAATGEAT